MTLEEWKQCTRSVGTLSKEQDKACNNLGDLKEETGVQAC